MRTIEICCSSVAEAKIAENCGATRVELCSALSLEGLTPSIGVVARAVKECINIKINVLVRAREGNFVYNEDEIATMVEDIKAIKSAGANAVVIGALTQDGEIDETACKRMIEAAKPEMEITFHRAFDMCANPIKAIGTLIELGVDRVLTSGQSSCATEGAELLKKVFNHASGKIGIMPGGGINDKNIEELQSITGATEFHASARKKPAGYKACISTAFATSEMPSTDANQVKALVG